MGHAVEFWDFSHEETYRIGVLIKLDQFQVPVTDLMGPNKTYQPDELFVLFTRTTTAREFQGSPPTITDPGDEWEEWVRITGRRKLKSGALSTSTRTLWWLLGPDAEADKDVSDHPWYLQALKLARTKRDHIWNVEGHLR